MRWLRSRGAYHIQSLAQAPAVGGVLVCGLISVALTACGPISQAAPSQTYRPVIHVATATGTPTPGPLTYTVGAWPSNSAPSPDGRVTIYVAFRYAGTPVAGGKVWVTVHYPGHVRTYGPTWTNRGGFAAINVPVGSALVSGAGGHEQIVEVSARVVYRGQTYPATTGFTLLP